jgi:hypothetical protein
MTTTTDFAKARAELERAEQRATVARQRADEAGAREAERRTECERRWDEAMLACYDPEQLDADVADAEHRLEGALAADPVVNAAVALRKAKMRRRLADELKVGIVTRLTGEPPVYNQPPTDVIVGDTIERFVERRGSQLAHQEVERWWAQREAAANESTSTA